jgi:hypothetical protein
MTKGQQKINKDTGEVYNDQGIIKGNRYGISKDARAPDWECISEFEAAHMGQIVREVGEMICIASDKIRAKINSEKAKQNAQKAVIAKLNVKNYAAKLSPAIIKKRMQAANAILTAASAKISGLTQLTRQADYSNKFKITFRGRERLDAFLQYSIIQREWKATQKEVKQKEVLAIDPKTGLLVRYSPNKQAISISNWAKKVHKDLELYWCSLMSDVDNQSREIIQNV